MRLLERGWTFLERLDSPSRPAGRELVEWIELIFCSREQQLVEQLLAYQLVEQQCLEQQLCTIQQQFERALQQLQRCEQLQRPLELQRRLRPAPSPSRAWPRPGMNDTLPVARAA